MGVKFDLGPTPHIQGGQTSAEAPTGNAELREIEDALERLNSGEFGYCECCGGKLELSRLCADPTVSICTKCLD
ncbi:MAG: hypothetical protein AAFQ22_12215 [Pseudomonadota bacterium]